MSDNLPAVRESFTRDQYAAARAWAKSYGEPVGDRGRLPEWLMTDWARNLRPDPRPVAPVKGTRGGRSTVVVNGSVRPVSRVDSQNARAWAIGEGIAIGRTRLATDVLQAWADAGAPVVDPVREERATLIYQPTLDKSGRKNRALKTQTVVIYADQLPSTKPRSVDYWNAVRDELPVGSVPLRIHTANTMIDVHPDTREGAAPGDYVFSWVSKADSKGSTWGADKLHSARGLTG